jgi:hypothetical protein
MADEKNAQIQGEVQQWMQTLNAKQLQKLLALRDIITDPPTCERITEVKKVDSDHWEVRWGNGGKA